MGALKSIKGSIWLPLGPAAVRGVEELKDGRLRATIEMVRPNVRINQFMPKPEFIANTAERWAGVDIVSTHEHGARFDVVAGLVESVVTEKGTGALVAKVLTNLTSKGKDLAVMIKDGRVSWSIGATDPVLGVDPTETPEPWDVVDATPNHLMATRLDHQAQPDAQTREIHATGDVAKLIKAAGHLDEEEEEVEASAHIPPGKAGGFARFLFATISRMVGQDQSQPDIEGRLVEVAGITTERLAALMIGSEMPTLPELRAFSLVLWAGLEDLMVNAEAAGMDFGDIEVEAQDDEVQAILSSPRVRARIRSITLQGAKAPGTIEAKMKDDEKQKKLEAEIESLKGKLEESSADRDKLVNANEEREHATLVAEIHTVEAKMGKEENDLTDFKGKSLEDVRAAHAKIHVDFVANPPKAKAKVPVEGSFGKADPRDAPTERPNLFGRQGPRSRLPPAAEAEA